MRYALIEMNEAQAIFIGLTTAFPEDTQVTFALCVKSSARSLHSIPRHQMGPDLCFTRDHAMSHCARDRTLIAFLCLRHRAFQLVSDVIAKMHLSGSDSNNSPCCPICFKFTAKVESEDHRIYLDDVKRTEKLCLEEWRRYFPDLLFERCFAWGLGRIKVQCS